MLLNIATLITPHSPAQSLSRQYQFVGQIWMQITTSGGSGLDATQQAEQIFIIGYSLPETDAFFRHLYALGSVGEAPLRRIVVFNPDQSGETDRRFRSLLGPGAIARYEYQPQTFDTAISHIKNLFPKAYD